MRIVPSSGGLVASFACFAALVSCGSKAPGSSVADSNVGNSGNAGSGGSSFAGGTTTGSVGAANSTSGPNLNVNPSGGADGADASAAVGPTTSDGEVCGTTCPADQAACAPETCDGVDNNCDGIIDNIDKNSDGICDCILIATLGVRGTWGQGNVFATWLASRSNNGATSLGDQILTPDLLAKYEVIVAQDVHMNHPYSPAEAQALQDWVTKGGGFMTLIGYSPPGDAMNVNQLLLPFGMSYGDRSILPKNGGSTIPIAQWVPHPIDLGVTAVGVDNGYAVQGMGTVIATGGGYDVGNAQQVGMGHVFQWGDEWITYDSEWTAHPDYQVQLLWLNAIKWLTVQGTCQVPIPPSLGGVVK